MRSCDHTRLVLLPQKEEMLRCRQCHLLIRASELGGGCCPECLEERGVREYDFEGVEEEAGPDRYRCEECGVIIESN